MARLPSQVSGDRGSFKCGLGSFRKCEHIENKYTIVRIYRIFGPVYLHSENKEQESIDSA